jgi:4-hydroxy-3-polyprenylbenzoate decarboxylase|tara:strand:+ start:274 stop:873 length:600 start_codon:yes stop_codon:yes gene_type:complete
VNKPRIVVGITGASGAPYALRVLELLLEGGVEVHLTVSDLGKRILFEESKISTLSAENLGLFEHEHNLVIYNNKDLGASVASGSFLHGGMIVLPCSSNTLGAIGSGITNTLVQRAAAVTLKERRTLVIAHRESPVSLVDLKNMATITEAGGIIAPLSPGFYMNPKNINDIVDFMAGKLVDLLGVEHNMPVRWNSTVYSS